MAKGTTAVSSEVEARSVPKGGGANADGHVHEEHLHAWRRLGDFAVWRGTVQP